MKRFPLIPEWSLGVGVGVQGGIYGVRPEGGKVGMIPELKPWVARAPSTQGHRLQEESVLSSPC